METKDIIKERSFSACIRDAFEMFCSNFATLFRRTWLPALVFALVFGLCMPSGTPKGGLDDIVLTAQLIGLFASTTLLLPWFWARVLPMFSANTAKQAYWKTVRLTLMQFVIVSIAGLVAGIAFVLPLGIAARHNAAAQAQAAAQAAPDAQGLGMAIGIAALCMVAVLVVCALVLVPCIYSFTAYAVEPARHLRHTLTADYRTAWRHYGLLFGVVAIMVLIQVMASVVLSAPSMVLTAAQAANAAGTSLGDPDMLPGSFGLLYFVSYTASAFIYCYVYMLMFFAFLFAYGSVKHRLQEREAMKASHDALAMTPQDKATH